MNRAEGRIAAQHDTREWSKLWVSSMKLLSADRIFFAGYTIRMSSFSSNPLPRSSRRQWLQTAGGGIGAMALQSLLQEEGYGAGDYC